MVFQVALRWLTFKQDISNINKMLESQIATYAILRYAYDIPEATYKKAMDELAVSADYIDDRRLARIVDQWVKINNVGLQDWEEESVGVLTMDWDTGEMIYTEGDTIVWQNTVAIAKESAFIQRFEYEEDDDITLTTDDLDQY